MSPFRSLWDTPVLLTTRQLDCLSQELEIHPLTCPQEGWGLCPPVSQEDKSCLCKCQLANTAGLVTFTGTNPWKFFTSLTLRGPRLTSSLCPHSPFKTPSHLCTNQVEIQSLRTLLPDAWVDYGLKSVLTTLTSVQFCLSLLVIEHETMPPTVLKFSVALISFKYACWFPDMWRRALCPTGHLGIPSHGQMLLQGLCPHPLYEMLPSTSHCFPIFFYSFFLSLIHIGNTLTY